MFCPVVLVSEALKGVCRSMLLPFIKDPQDGAAPTHRFVCRPIFWADLHCSTPPIKHIGGTSLKKSQDYVAEAH